MNINTECQGRGKEGVKYIMMSEYILARIQAIQQDLEELKSYIKNPKRRVKLKGLWKGVNISEEDIEEAKQAVFEDTKFRRVK